MNISFAKNVGKLSFIINEMNRKEHFLSAGVMIRYYILASLVIGEINAMQ